MPSFVVMLGRGTPGHASFTCVSLAGHWRFDSAAWRIKGGTCRAGQPVEPLAPLLFLSHTILLSLTSEPELIAGYPSRRYPLAPPTP